MWGRGCFLLNKSILFVNVIFFKMFRMIFKGVSFVLRFLYCLLESFYFL